MAKQSKEARPKGAHHWADATAERIVRQRGERDRYVLAAGITPSGTVHFGNMREIITPELVARALRRAGYAVRFIYLWDDYDRFRSVPANLPGDGWERYIGVPLSEIPDPVRRVRELRPPLRGRVRAADDPAWHRAGVDLAG